VCRAVGWEGRRRSMRGKAHTGLIEARKTGWTALNICSVGPCARRRQVRPTQGRTLHLGSHADSPPTHFAKLNRDCELYPLLGGSEAYPPHAGKPGSFAARSQIATALARATAAMAATALSGLSHRPRNDGPAVQPVLRGRIGGGDGADPHRNPEPMR
jgi:hypothetical protein